MAIRLGEGLKDAAIQAAIQMRGSDQVEIRFEYANARFKLKTDSKDTEGQFWGRIEAEGFEDLAVFLLPNDRQ